MKLIRNENEEIRVICHWKQIDKQCYDVLNKRCCLVILELKCISVCC